MSKISTKMKTITTFFLVAILLIFSCSLSIATRTEPATKQPPSKGKPSTGNQNNNNNNKGGGGGGTGNDGGGIGGFFGPGPGFDIPGFGKGWGNGIIGGGYGAGYGGPKGGYSKGGVVRPSVVCKDKGPCYNKKLTCPAKCFTSYSRSGKGYGGGGGGGGCTMDCKKKCIAYC